ncbi:geranylgeranyl transferase type-2 subunit alpha protein [Rutstroemia sp. NJR-2017a BBW]|nr:geranylgeranyl transferase type-2 subunit alpha protein [Rutstroemia sp. NJR-2017a BBW]
MVGWPKCYWIWNYRLWLLKQANERLDAQVARRLWEHELVLVGKMLTRDSRNFHGWGYRRTVVSQLESPELNGSSMIESEFEYTTRMITRELKNFSAWHNRSKLIPRLLDERKATDAERRQFLDDEFDIITRAMWNDAYPYDQSVWFYHQFLMSTLTESVGHATITPNFTRDDRIEYIQRQLVNLRDFQDGGEDCKWVYNALLEYTLAVCEMEERLPGHDEVEDCKAWLSQLRKLDPMREGRWNDLEKSLKSSRVLSEEHH